MASISPSTPEQQAAAALLEQAELLVEILSSAELGAETMEEAHKISKLHTLAREYLKETRRRVPRT